MASTRRRHRMNALKRERRKCPIMKISNDAITSIFEHLGEKDLLRCMKVCREWFSLGKNESLWINHCMKEYMPRDISSFFEYRWSRYIFKGKVFCVTGFSLPERTMLRKLVEYMGGEWSFDYVAKRVSHLIVGRYGSEKHLAAKRDNKIIANASYLYDAICNGYVSEDLDRYRLPLFNGHEVTVTGGCMNARNTIKVLIEYHGGVFSYDMKKDSSTLLVVINDQNSRKMKMAKEWNIPRVDMKWLQQSLIKNEYLSPKNRLSDNEMSQIDDVVNLINLVNDQQTFVSLQN